jgi:type II secretory pathway component PulF
MISIINYYNFSILRMAILGVLIGGLVMSMYLPIFKLGGAV